MMQYKWMILILVQMLFLWCGVDCVDVWNITCPARCTCEVRAAARFGSNLRTVDCDNSKLNSIPTLPPDTEVLFLRKNVIASIADRLHDLFDLKEVDLSSNLITGLGRELLFSNLTSLRYLTLDDNQLEYLAGDSFNQVSNLRGLSLANNHLAKIEQDTFMGLSHLRTLILTGNNLTQLQHDWFRMLTALETLQLDSNQLTHLEDGLFQELIHLNQLSLANNQLAKIEQDTFMGLSHLRTLILTGNNLTQLQHDWFRMLTALETLQLDSNQLTHLEDGLFQELIHLNQLSLANNQLVSLSNYVFKGLDLLQTLLFNRNLLTEVPKKSLSIFKSLKILTMNDNPIPEINPGDFDKLKISEVNMDDMENLAVINNGAFCDMPELSVLQLHDNHKLTFIDSEAFSLLPKLRRLYLHNNNLMAIPYTLPALVPSIQQITFYHNPIHCDCNIYWIKKIIANNATVNTSAIEFPGADKATCDMPIALNGRLLSEVPFDHIPEMGPPTVIPFFNDSSQRELGETITYECRAIGVPMPHIHWILPNGKVVNNTSNFSQVRISSPGTLTLLNVKAINAGTYTCIATSSMGYDTTSTVLQIHNKNIHILPKGIATNFITVTWNGTSRTISTSDYVILYRKQGSDEEYGRIHLRPYMRTYTITNLQPQNVYEFCIAYQHKDEVVKLNCLDIQTKHQMYVTQGIHRISSMSIILAISTTIVIILLLCLSVSMIKRYLRRKAYKEPEGTNTAPPPVVPYNGKVGQMSQIPLDNLYHPPSTPICTSRTSLIGQVHA